VTISWCMTTSTAIMPSGPLPHDATRCINPQQTCTEQHCQVNIAWPQPNGMFWLPADTVQQACTEQHCQDDVALPLNHTLAALQTLYSKRVMELLGAFRATFDQPGGRQLWSRAATTWLSATSSTPGLGGFSPTYTACGGEESRHQGATTGSSTAAPAPAGAEAQPPPAAASREGCSLKVVSVGGGPGSDLFAAAAFIKDLPRKLGLVQPEQLQAVEHLAAADTPGGGVLGDTSSMPGDTGSNPASGITPNTTPTTTATTSSSGDGSSGVSSVIASSIVTGAAGLKTQLTCLDAEAGWEGVVTTSLDTLSDAPPEFMEAAFEDELSFATCQVRHGGHDTTVSSYQLREVEQHSCRSNSTQGPLAHNNNWRHQPLVTVDATSPASHNLCYLQHLMPVFTCCSIACRVMQEADVVLFSFVLGDFPVAATLVERLVAAWQSPQSGGKQQHRSTRPDSQKELLALQKGSEQGSSACAGMVEGVSQDAGQGTGSTSTPGGKEDTPCVPHKGPQLGQAQDHRHQQEDTHRSSSCSSREEGSRRGAWPRLICIADRFPVKERFQVPPELPRVTVHVQHEGERRTWLQGEGKGLLPVEGASLHSLREGRRREGFAGSYAEEQTPIQPCCRPFVCTFEFRGGIKRGPACCCH
jgi:hypothetical protein